MKKNFSLSNTLIKFLSIFLTVGQAWCASIQVIYPQPESLNDTRSNYFVDLLNLALSKTSETYIMRPYAQKMTQTRALKQLEINEGIDVVWTVTSIERERDLLPIKIPLDKGLFGWRLFLINKNDHDKFENIRSKKELMIYAAGQGYDWPDTQILRLNNLNVVTGSDYDALFKMLRANRFQFFPRSVLEIWEEEKNHPDLNLEIERSTALHYNSCIYFFVNKRNTRLYDLIDRGLRFAMDDGSFDQLFELNFRKFINKSNLNSRTIIELENPLFPEKIPAENQKFWFRR